MRSPEFTRGALNRSLLGRTVGERVTFAVACAIRLFVSCESEVVSLTEGAISRASMMLLAQWPPAPAELERLNTVVEHWIEALGEDCPYYVDDTLAAVSYAIRTFLNDSVDATFAAERVINAVVENVEEDDRGPGFPDLRITQASLPYVREVSRQARDLAEVRRVRNRADANRLLSEIMNRAWEEPALNLG